MRRVLLALVGLALAAGGLALATRAHHDAGKPDVALETDSQARHRVAVQACVDAQVRAGHILDARVRLLCERAAHDQPPPSPVTAPSSGGMPAPPRAPPSPSPSLTPPVPATREPPRPTSSAPAERPPPDPSPPASPSAPASPAPTPRPPSPIAASPDPAPRDPSDGSPQREAASGPASAPAPASPRAASPTPASPAPALPPTPPRAAPPLAAEPSRTTEGPRTGPDPGGAREEAGPVRVPAPASIVHAAADVVRGLFTVEERAPMPALERTIFDAPFQATDPLPNAVAEHARLVDEVARAIDALTAPRAAEGSRSSEAPPASAARGAAPGAVTSAGPAAAPGGSAPGRAPTSAPRDGVSDGGADPRTVGAAGPHARAPAGAASEGSDPPLGPENAPARCTRTCERADAHDTATRANAVRGDVAPVHVQVQARGSGLLSRAWSAVSTWLAR